MTKLKPPILCKDGLNLSDQIRRSLSVKKN